MQELAEVGIGMGVRAAPLSSLGWAQSWEMTCSRKSTRAAPIRDSSGESSSSCRRQHYVTDGEVVRSDCIIKIHPNVVEAGRE